jgi:hypothetical protein
MQAIGTATDNPIAFILALGFLGGSALIVATFLTHRGPVIFVPYTAIVLITAAYLRLEHVTPFRRRFGIALGVFMVATLVFHLFITAFKAKTILKISLFGHAWRIGFMLAIGAVLSLCVAQVTATRSAGPRVEPVLQHHE